MPRRATFVVVSGPPGSGKSTLAAQLAHHLRLPLIAKDTIKEALMVVLGAADVDRSRELGRAAVTAMYAVASESPLGAVLESSFARTLALADISRLDGRVVEVFCRCDRDVVAQRYAARASSRASGHFDALRTPDDLWNDENAEPVGGDWPVLAVDTTAAVDVERLAGRILAGVDALRSDSS